ncbi:restriction endonuclease PLD domain-containing protein [Acetobacterium wieringae]|uniref:restriction endonuclease PLD domain-containing protein n=1 Tax=Acetobacterium wieringae TaxID=52694 RepID=UPI0020343B0A|nr:restriction endonuclease PLD domain-containing protein [Acetobacterium wieringae]URN83918.1 NgoFVII family restriction endonuclease [Acetobacterium wieringae]
MDFLYSNFPPLKTTKHSFSDEFYLLLSESDALDIAVGYVTADSLAELKKTVEMNDKLSRLRLIIGMHFLDKFTEQEYHSAMELNSFLKNSSRGSVKLVTPFRFHGKLYAYERNGIPYAGVIGSNNLSSIIGNSSRVYEASVLFKDQQDVCELIHFINELDKEATEEIDCLDICDFKEKKNPLLENHENVFGVPPAGIESIKNNLTSITFTIPLKSTLRSNLNVFFGKGREARNGLIKPRHWYEVELIVPKELTCKSEYPKSKTDSAEFDVVTDDGWRFKCKVSGDFSKNFRSADDLKILGKWIKGRLENAGALKVGELVTPEVFKKYGRDNFSLTKTKENGLWFLDFGVDR